MGKLCERTHPTQILVDHGVIFTFSHVYMYVFIFVNALCLPRNALMQMSCCILEFVMANVYVSFLAKIRITEIYTGG
jgi:hypothetical protein